MKITWMLKVKEHKKGLFQKYKKKRKTSHKKIHV